MRGLHSAPTKCHELSDFYRRSGGEDRRSRAFEQERAISTSSSANRAALVWWGRVIFYVTDLTHLRRALAAGYQPATVPAMPNGVERFFHLVDRDGHDSVLSALLPVSVQ